LEVAAVHRAEIARPETAGDLDLFVTVLPVLTKDGDLEIDTRFVHRLAVTVVVLDELDDRLEGVVEYPVQLLRLGLLDDDVGQFRLRHRTDHVHLLPLPVALAHQKLAVLRDHSVQVSL
ncbi:hypothetical protein PFISCL1PPCAC_20674, partial [Pristionchus fissidentatus]